MSAARGVLLRRGGHAAHRCMSPPPPASPLPPPPAAPPTHLALTCSSLPVPPLASHTPVAAAHPHPLPAAEEKAEADERQAKLAQKQQKLAALAVKGVAAPKRLKRKAKKGVRIKKHVVIRVGGSLWLFCSKVLQIRRLFASSKMPPGVARGPLGQSLLSILYSHPLWPLFVPGTCACYAWKASGSRMLRATKRWKVLTPAVPAVPAVLTPAVPAVPAAPAMPCLLLAAGHQGEGCGDQAQGEAGAGCRAVHAGPDDGHR